MYQCSYIPVHDIEVELRCTSCFWFAKQSSRNRTAKEINVVLHIQDLLSNLVETKKQNKCHE